MFGRDYDDEGGGLATEAEAHREWHRNAGVPVGQPCPWDACDPYAGAGYDEDDEPEPEPVRSYTASFRNVSDAQRFADRIRWPGWSATNVACTGKTVTFDGPPTGEYFGDMLDTVGYYGSPPGEPRRVRPKGATLNGVPAPPSY